MGFAGPGAEGSGCFLETGVLHLNQRLARTNHKNSEYTTAFRREPQMKYHIERNTVQETLVIPLYGRKRCSQLYPAGAICSATRILRIRL